MLVKFKEAEIGQIFKHGDKIVQEQFKNQIFVKVVEDKKSTWTCDRCNGSYNWNTINVNSNGAFKVHFCPDTIIEFDLHHATKWQDVSIIVNKMR